MTVEEVPSSGTRSAPRGIEYKVVKNTFVQQACRPALGTKLDECSKA
jgi:hypothetical protein